MKQYQVLNYARRPGSVWLHPCYAVVVARLGAVKAFWTVDLRNGRVKANAAVSEVIHRLPWTEPGHTVDHSTDLGEELAGKYWARFCSALAVPSDALIPIPLHDRAVGASPLEPHFPASACTEDAFLLMAEEGAELAAAALQFAHRRRINVEQVYLELFDVLGCTPYAFKADGVTEELAAALASSIGTAFGLWEKAKAAKGYPRNEAVWSAVLQLVPARYQDAATAAADRSHNVD